MKRITLLATALLMLFPFMLQAQDLKQQAEPLIREVEEEMIRWRRHLHEHPELSNREEETAAYIAARLKEMGIEVQENIARHGVVGTLKGGKPGRVVGLRADIDALPVKEMTDVPFKSTAMAEFNGQETGVMHACGHDAHMSILLATASVLSDMKDDIPGTVIFVFQPAEEGPPPGEEGGASLMIKEGLLDGPDAPEVMFGLHVWPEPPGQLSYRSEGTMAASDRLVIKIKGQQTHGSSPWAGVDPVIVAGQVMEAVQMIPSRQLDITKAPAVVSIGRINGGIRFNIIPDEVEMQGTIRTFDSEMREDLLMRIRRTAEKTAEAAGATAEVEIQNMAPVTYNNPALVQHMLPTLMWAADKNEVTETPLIMGAEDFAFFQEKIPGFYFFLGVNKEGVDKSTVPRNHSPYFYVNEDALLTGVRAMTGMALDYLESQDY
ncbi:MAG: amidohydrolase [Cyclobacteriaceae bacterium]